MARILRADALDYSLTFIRLRKSPCQRFSDGGRPVADEASYFWHSYGALWPSRWRGNDVLLTSSTPKMRASLETARRGVATTGPFLTIRASAIAPAAFAIFA